MESDRRSISEIGEKRLIAEYLRPLLNPSSNPRSVGDDCALAEIPHGHVTCVSTDRVPADLTAFRLKIMNHFDLGHYLAILNISDIAAAGGTPCALLLNLGLPLDFPLGDLIDIVRGAKAAADNFDTPILGGDLSAANEISLVATAVGHVDPDLALFRSNAKPGDLVFCSSSLGITPSAFAYYNTPPTARPTLSDSEERTLHQNFLKPTARISLGRRLAESRLCTSCMDNTDGIGQSLAEIAAASSVSITITLKSLPVAVLTQRIAEALSNDCAALALSAGADFQLVGTVDPGITSNNCGLLDDLIIIGTVHHGDGVFTKDAAGNVKPFSPSGWNYFSTYRSP